MSAKPSRAYRSSRRRAWRNLLVAAINAGLEQGLFSLEPGDNRRPAPVVDGRRDSFVFSFEFPGGLPALCSVAAARYEELAIRAALRPTADAVRWLPASGAGFLAGDAVATGWLERRTRPYLQSSPENFRCRRGMQEVLAAAEVEPAGYADQGRVVL